MNNINDERGILTLITGNQTWAEVEEWFSGMTVEQIEAEASRCWPQEPDNDKLAKRIYEAL